MHLTNYCKKYLQNFKYSVKRVCSFHLILVGIPSILILSVKNRGGGGVCLMDKPVNRGGRYLSTVPNTLTPCTLQVPTVITLFVMAGYLVCTRQSYTRQSSSTIIKALSTNNFRHA